MNHHDPFTAGLESLITACCLLENLTREVDWISLPGPTAMETNAEDLSRLLGEMQIARQEEVDALLISWLAEESVDNAPDPLVHLLAQGRLAHGWRIGTGLLALSGTTPELILCFSELSPAVIARRLTVDLCSESDDPALGHCNYLLAVELIASAASEPRDSSASRN